MKDFADLARGLAEATDEDARLQLAVHTAVELVEGCDHAGVTIVEQTRGTQSFTTRAATDGVVQHGDRWQYDLGEGPCLDTVRGHEIVLSQDLSRDGRWPARAPRVHQELGVSSMLSLPLYTARESYGALNLYGDQARAIGSDAMATANALAGHLAVAMAAGRGIHHLGRALVSRTVIGQAEGILMERFNMDAAQAFAYLQRMSSHLNRKLVSVADEIVRTRELPKGLP